MAGAAEVVITPRPGVELAGYGPRLDRRATGAHDDLTAQALVVRQGDVSTLFISTDLFGLSSAFAARVRSGVAAATGIPGGNVLVAASHSHTSPTAVATREWGAPDAAYLDDLVDGLVAVSRAALERVRPVDVRFARGEVTGLSYNRVTGVSPTAIDPDVVAIAFSAAEEPGTIEAMIVTFACHPVTLGPTTATSADFPGEIRSTLRARYPGCTVLYFSAACGDIDPATNQRAWGSGTYAEVRSMGAALGMAAAEALERNPEFLSDETATVRVERAEIELAYELPTLEDVRQNIRDYTAELSSHAEAGDRLFGNVNESVPMPKFWLAHYRDLLAKLEDGSQPEGEQLELQRIDIGNELSFVAIPAEAYVTMGQRLKRRFRPREVVPLCYANGVVGYLAPASEYDRGSYTTRLASAVNLRPPFVRGTAERVEEAIAELLRR